MPNPQPTQKVDQPFLTPQNIFPDSHAVFKFSLKSLKQIKSNCIVALDTNVLLTPYTIGKNSLKEIEGKIRALIKAKRLIIPGQVAREFAKNRAKKIGELFQQLSRKQSKIESLQQGKYPLLEAAPAYQEIINLEKQADELLAKYGDALANVLDHIRS